MGGEKDRVRRMKEQDFLKTRVWLGVLIFLFLSLALPEAGPALAATFTVNSTTDEPDADVTDGMCATAGGLCTLRAAIQQANDLFLFDPFTPNTIILPAGTYNLTRSGAADDTALAGDLDITGDLSINGAGASLTIVDGTASAERVFHVFGVTINLFGLTIRNGDAGGQSGGGIRNENGILSLQDCQINGHTAGADGGGLYNAANGVVFSSGSSFSQNQATGSGGGIYNDGLLVFQTGSLLNNGAQDGGGIYTSSLAPDVNLGNATFSGNSAAGNGGGIFNTAPLTLGGSTLVSNSAANGGGLYNYFDALAGLGGEAQLENVTFSANSAGTSGGGIWNVNVVTLTHGTLQGNLAGTGGGLANDVGGTFSLQNTIVAGSTGGNCQGTITSLGGNLDSGSTCGFGDPTDLNNTAPLLGPLADNGGLTQTHALTATSPAINSGIDLAQVVADQRGFPRIVPYDRGAFEYQIPVITGIIPTEALAGGLGFMLTVDGQNFMENARVRWGATDLTTLNISSTQLTATVQSTDITQGGLITVTVFNPPPGGGTSNGVAFTLNNPLPVVTTLTPNSALAGSGQLVVTVDGSSFVNGAVVRWNGTDLATNFVGPGQLTATIPAANLATAGTATITVFNPAPGGGLSNGVTFSILQPNPNPVILTLTPTWILTGSPGFDLALDGFGFMNGSVVRWNGTDLATTFVNSAQLTAAIPTANLAAAGTATITVFNPAPGGGLSNGVLFSVRDTNPLPVITGILPPAAAIGTPGISVTVLGMGFADGAVVRWNGTDRQTLFVNNDHLTAVFTTADLAAPTTATVTVFNPLPGGGLSNGQPFLVGYLLYLPVISK